MCLPWQWAAVVKQACSWISVRQKCWQLQRRVSEGQACWTASGAPAVVTKTGFGTHSSQSTHIIGFWEVHRAAAARSPDHYRD